MKALRAALGLFFLSMLVFNNSMAQKASFTNNGGMTIGLGAGWAYQKSDLANSKGFGIDFTLGSQLYHKENAFLGVDWNFRFLAGENKAYDHRINPDNTYSNIRYSFFNYDLELGLTLNRLRERTGIVITGFAGAGITHGRTFTDLYDAGNSLYDYGSIDPNRDSKLVYKDLVTLSDGDFETRLVNKAALLPTAGLFIGYQLSRSLILGIEFKTNFYLTEKNSFAGIDLDNRVISGSGIDRNNYVSLGLRWNLRGGSSHNSAANNYSTDVTNNYGNTVDNNNRIVPGSLPHPSVNITNPTADNYHTESPFNTIRATITNVSGPDNISFYQNDFPNNSFTYNANTKIFTANVRLNDGENSFRITATNQGSSAEDLAIITLGNPGDTAKPAPLVDFTSPAETQITSSDDRINVTASVKNVSSKQDIQLTLNGTNTPFEYYPISEMVKTSVSLAEGDNNLLINAFNESGSAQDELAIHFSISEYTAIPTVRFINPAMPVEVVNNRFPLSAEIQNVRGRNDLTVRWNGTSINNFLFDANGTLSVSLLLPEGINTMEITARNESGAVSESTSITFRGPVRNEPVYYEPVYQQPVYQQPVYQQPVNQQPVNQQPVNQQPVYQQPVNQQPVTYEPATRERVTRDPVAFEPATREGVTRERVTRDPVTRERVTRDPVTFNPGNSNPGNSNPGNSNPGTQPSPPAVIVPCTPPTVSFTLQEVNRNDATHELRGSVSGVQNKTDLLLTLDGRAFNGIQFTPSTGDLSAAFNLTPGSHTVVAEVNNACGKDSKSVSVTREEEDACGIRINPGNAAWQFCLVTPSGTFSRENLTNTNFSYSGQASSLYFMPIGGGGEATVNGRSFAIRSGQYYLFTGNLKVTVSTSNPGSMGQWSVCISADREPVSGNGNNRPQSPCEVKNNNSSKGKGNGR